MSSAAADILQEESPTISLDLLISKYIPLLLDPDPAIFNMTWINEISKNPLLEVRVLDGSGDTVYTIPPLVQSANTIETADIQHMATMAVLESNVHEARGQAVLREQLPRLVSFTNSDNSKGTNVWRTILNDHGFGEHIRYNTRSEQISTEGFDIIEDDEW